MNPESSNFQGSMSKTNRGIEHAKYYHNPAAMHNDDAITDWIRVTATALWRKIRPSYHFPRSAFIPQADLVTAEVLLNQQSSRMIFDLLTQLEMDGHDVSGAYFEYFAMRHVIRTYAQDMD